MDGDPQGRDGHDDVVKGPGMIPGVHTRTYLERSTSAGTNDRNQDVAIYSQKSQSVAT